MKVVRFCSLFETMVNLNLILVGKIRIKSKFIFNGLMPNNGCMSLNEAGMVNLKHRPEMSLLHFVLVQMLAAI